MSTIIGGAPGLEDLDLFDPDTFARGVPHDVFTLLRRVAPIHWHPEPASAGFWAVTRYADVLRVSRDVDTFSSGLGATLIIDPPAEDLATMQLMMLNMDPPRHSRLRALVNKGFTPRTIARLEDRIRRLCTEIVDGIAEVGECDFVAAVAAELPLQVIAELLGIPHEDRQRVFDWSNCLIGFDDPELGNSFDGARTAAVQMYLYANQLALERRAQPRDDLVSVLMMAEIDGEKLSELEFDLFFLLLAVAGNETTRNLISGGLLALIEHPQERQRLLTNPALLPTAIEEMFRWVSPVIQFRRTARHDTGLSGQWIRAGDKVVVYYSSANRDEAVFDEPQHFDVARTPNEHLAFGGGGAHFCLGASLARLECRLVFEELLRRLPDMELSGPVRRLRSNFINGIKHMPVVYTPHKPPP